MEKTVLIGEREVKFRSSAALPHIYRRKFNRDLFVDMSALQGKINMNRDGTSSLDVNSLELFENLAYCFAKHADPAIPDDVEEWLEQFETFDIYHILPEIIGMWTVETKTTSRPKKKNGQ